MDEMQKIQYAANSYYNRGLEMAKERNLSGAARFLKRALQFNKYHTDARNLLGLIFYEMDVRCADPVGHQHQSPAGRKPGRLLPR